MTPLQLFRGKSERLFHKALCLSRSPWQADTDTLEMSDLQGVRLSSSWHLPPTSVLKFSDLQTYPNTPAHNVRESVLGFRRVRISVFSKMSRQQCRHFQNVIRHAGI